MKSFLSFFCFFMDEMECSIIELSPLVTF
jgi:hypothetical protein